MLNLGIFEQFHFSSLRMRSKINTRQKLRFTNADKFLILMQNTTFQKQKQKIRIIYVY